MIVANYWKKLFIIMIIYNIYIYIYICYSIVWFVCAFGKLIYLIILKKC